MNEVSPTVLRSTWRKRQTKIWTVNTIEMGTTQSGWSRFAKQAKAIEKGELKPAHIQDRPEERHREGAWQAWLVAI